MKKFLSIVGGIVLVVVLMAAGFIGYLSYQGRGLDASSKAYVDKNLPLIVSNWSKRDLLKQASPQLLTIINENPDQIDRLFKGLARLGALRSYDGSKGDANISYTNKDGKLITAFYIANATFENGSAQITVRLIQVSGQWKFLMFQVNSPLFMS